MKKKSSFKSMGDVLEVIIKRMQPPADSWIDSIKEKWPSIVGPAIAKNTKIDRIEESTLIVKVTSHMWKNELRSGLGLTILKKIQSI